MVVATRQEHETDDLEVPRWVDPRIRDLFRDGARTASDDTNSDDEAGLPHVAV